jgi:hypothetical protein
MGGSVLLICSFDKIYKLDTEQQLSRVGWVSSCSHQVLNEGSTRQLGFQLDDI